MHAGEDPSLNENHAEQTTSTGKTGEKAITHDTAVTNDAAEKGVWGDMEAVRNHSPGRLYTEFAHYFRKQLEHLPVSLRKIEVQ